MANSSGSMPHFVLIPLMAQGHMIPMIDIARLLAARGAVVTVITTPLNASRFKTTVDLAVETGLAIRLADIRFPCQEAGLPEGCENLDVIPSKDLVMNFFMATAMLQQPVEEHLRQLQPPPSCIISDMGLPWSSTTARKLGIPRLIFHGTCCFSLLCSTNIRQSNILDGITSDSEPFVVPGLPHRIEITKSQLPENFAAKTANSLRDAIREAEVASLGTVVNSFEGMEPECFKNYQKALGKKVWAIGPVPLCNKGKLEKIGRGDKASIDENKCLSWLESKSPSSVIYVSFGTLTRETPAQLMEIGLGLETSKRPFIWVIREGKEGASEVEKWLSEGFEERNKERCLLIRGWAPQVLILSHPAIGGFFTHCGWNSCIEGVTAGLPMVTRPLFAEQFFNEKLIVDVLRIGVSLGIKVPTKWQEEEVAGVLVKRGEVAKAVERLMDEGEEGEERRKRAKEYGDMAKKAMEEGGSSYVNLTLMIQAIMNYSTSTAL